MRHAVMLEQDTLASDDLDLSALVASADQYTAFGSTEASQMAERIGDADCVIVNKLPISAELLQELPNLKLICVVATGVNNIDVNAAKAKNVCIVNCRAYGTEAVSQHVLSLMLALSTQLLSYANSVSAGRWQSAQHFCFLDYPIVELAGKTLLIVGHGELGSAVGRLAAAFGMNVEIAERPDAKETRPGRVSFATAIEQADIVTLHCPLTPSTENLINRDVLARMKRSAFIINTARGGIINEQDLADALRAGEIAGAGIDVLSKEPPSNGNPLLAADIPNLIVTPHTAWGSQPARQRIVDQTVENIEAWKAGQPIRQVI
ncbi:MAG: 2-hydroxyacid dehydrogenase [Gammaproteobacteria bacterium]|nr:2-hydroxyacid dehydrogenase [Gammaproteobacteria bacterium]